MSFFPQTTTTAAASLRMKCFVIIFFCFILFFFVCLCSKTISLCYYYPEVFFSHNFFLLMFRPRHSLSHKSLKFLGIFSTSFYSELYSWSTQFSKRDSFKSYFIFFLFVILILFSLFLFAVVLFYVAYHSVLEFFFQCF